MKRATFSGAAFMARSRISVSILFASFATASPRVVVPEPDAPRMWTRFATVRVCRSPAGYALARSAGAVERIFAAAGIGGRWFARLLEQIIAFLQISPKTSPLRAVAAVGGEERHKPAAACLGSRIPYGQRITLEKLQSVEKAEQVLRSFGFRQCRVRHHDDIARIEVGPDERQRFFDPNVMDEVSQRIKAAGYRYVCLELEGYRTGSLNRVLGTPKKNV